MHELSMSLLEIGDLIFFTIAIFVNTPETRLWAGQDDKGVARQRRSLISPELSVHFNIDSWNSYVSGSPQ